MLSHISKSLRSLRAFFANTISSLSDIGKSVRNYPRAIGLMWRCSPKETCVFSLLTLFSSAVVPVQIWLSKYIIDEVVEAVQATEGTSSAPHLRIILSLIAFQGVIWLASKTVESIASVMHEVLGMKLNSYIHGRIFEKISHLDLAFFESPSFFDQMKNASDQADWRVLNFVRGVSGLLQNVLTLATLLIMVANLHILAMLMLIVLSLPYVLTLGYFSNRRFRLISNRAPELRMVDYLSDLLSTRAPIKEIKLFGLYELLIGRYRALWNKFLRENRSLSLSQEISQNALNLLSTLGTAAVWAYAAFRAIGKHITIGEMVFYFQAAERAQRMIAGLFEYGGIFYENSLFLGHLFTFLDLHPNAVDGALERAEENSQPQNARKVNHPIQEGIVFENVSFKYPDTEDYVLKELSFTIAPGECIAIVGRNGAGKTTLVKLLTRLYDPSDGHIRLDGTHLKAYQLKNLHSQFGVIFQDFIHYHFSVRDNIGFGQVDARDDIERIYDAAKKSGSLAMIEKLAKQFDTVLGRTLEEGVELSGGEWQKMALARAFMRDAQILIMDEPTASLDAITEEEMFRRFHELTDGNTTIIISHKFSTVRMADRIIVLEEGRLIEQGTHDELVARNGTYAEMYTLQAKRYA